jgi:hypothetical protein
MDDGMVIKVPVEHTIIVDGFDGFKIIVPNGVDVYRLNEFLGRALEYTTKLIIERQGNHALERVKE